MFEVLKYINNDGSVIKLKNYKINKQGVVLRDNKEVICSYKKKKNGKGYGKFFNYIEENNKPILVDRALASTFDEENYHKGYVAKNGKWCKKKETVTEEGRKSVSNANKNKIMSEEMKAVLKEKKSKSIIQYTESGTFLKEWESAKEAGLQLNITPGNITKVCRNQRKSAGGYWWQYKVS